MTSEPKSNITIARTASAPGAIETPCLKICTLDLKGDMCTGCGRTRREIGGWSAMTPDERRRIMAELPARLKKR